MEKQKRWQFYLIITVVILTLYNILPTVFYYSKPLGSSIDSARAQVISESALHRVNQLEDDSKSWLASFCTLLGVEPKSIELNENNPGLIEVSFSSKSQADLFRSFV